ncbi:hypothetical protein, partial [Haloterrigena salina]|uniref:hypothetical protein n=1 Tax=Haloterrigena salina TaxID=504937 RepID=UPI0019552E42
TPSSRTVSVDPFWYSMSIVSPSTTFVTVTVVDSLIEVVVSADGAVTAPTEAVIPVATSATTMTAVRSFC